MGSRFMHLLVADYVAAELGIGDRGRILLGSLAPDSPNLKRSAHFKGALHPYALNAPLDYGRFIVKYRDQLSDAFYIGYLTHLVMDDVWTMKTDFSGFEAQVKSDPRLYDQYHGDLRLCNAKLDEFYRPDGLYAALESAVEVPQMEEIDTLGVLEYKREALRDFHYPAEHLTAPLGLFSLEEMIHYVERSKSKALDISRTVYTKT